MLALLFFLVGCGGGTAGTPSAPGAGTAPLQETATIEIRSILERAVPSEVDQIRLTGFDTGGAVRYGPSLKAKAALLTFTQVPTSVRRVQVEYLVEQRVLGVALADVILTPGSVTALSDLEFSTIEARLEGLSIEPASLTLARGTSGKLRAVGRYDDGSVLDLSGSVDWQNLGESCEIDTTGGVVAQEIGQDRIVASFGMFSAAAIVIVTDAEVEELRLEPADATVPLGAQQRFALKGLFSDGTTQDLTSEADFTLSYPEVASLQTLPGLFRGESVGKTEVSAGYGRLSARGTLMVTEAALTSLAVDPGESSLVKGKSLQLAARGTYTDDAIVDLSSAVQWTSSSPEICDVTPEGKVRGLAEGTARITASLGTFTSDSAISVGPAAVTSLSIEPASFSLTVGEQRFLAVTAQFSDLSTLDVTNDAVYTSGSPDVAGVSTLDLRGIVTGVAPGESTISAAFGGQSAWASVDVKARPVGDLVITLPLGPVDIQPSRRCTRLFPLSESAFLLKYSRVLGSKKHFRREKICFAQLETLNVNRP